LISAEGALRFFRSNNGPDSVSPRYSSGCAMLGPILRCCDASPRTWICSDKRSKTSLAKKRKIPNRKFDYAVEVLNPQSLRTS
jgi:hypothetical protein